MSREAPAIRREKGCGSMTSETHPLVRPCILDCRPYVAGRPRKSVQEMLGRDDVIKLASNENPLGPSPLALEAVTRAAREMHYYPDDASTELRERLSTYWGLPPQSFLVGNGSMQILELICKTFVNDGEEVISGHPSFRVFDGLVRAAGGHWRGVPLRDHVHDLEAMSAAIGHATKIVIVCNPNNPTGTVVAPSALRDFVAGFPSDRLLVLDEAYAEYCEEGAIPDFRELLEMCPNLLVLRSFSKAYGLAGARCGYAVGSIALINLLERARMPFVANALALAGAQAALDDVDFLERSRRNNQEGLARMRDGLRALGLQALETQTNFLAVRVGSNDLRYFEEMLQEGVIVFPGTNTDFRGWVRVTVGTPPQVERFLQATARVLERARHEIEAEPALQG
ncbi:MAG: histidinol-phosphate transaminase [Proteobacteria bacterium]|nr:histidinol-phosphate transaminase [Pseudomonadota bacterium]